MYYCIKTFPPCVHDLGVSYPGRHFKDSLKNNLSGSKMHKFTKGACSHCQLLICCSLVSLLAVLSAAKRSRWQALPFGSLSTASAPISLLCFLNLFCFCSSCLCRHHSFPPSYRQSGSAGSLLPSAFSLSTQLFALAIHRHTVGTHPSAAYNFRCHCQHNCCPCTVSAQTPTVFPGYKCHLSSAL